MSDSHAFDSHTNAPLAQAGWHYSGDFARVLFEEAAEAILVVDAVQHRYIDCNRSACQMLGYSREEILTLRSGDMSPEVQPNGKPSRALIEADVAFMFEHGKHQFEWVHRRKDGTLLETEVRLMRLVDDGERRVFRASLLDVSDRKRMERALRERELYLSNILNSPGLIVFSLDREYRYTVFNQMHKEVMRAIWGAEIQEGVSMLSYIASETDRIKAKANFDRAMLQGEEFTQVEEYGDELLMRSFYEDYYAPQRNAQGDIIGLTVFVKDITDRMRSARTLEWQNTQLGKVNEELNNLVYRTSHDLRAPIASLQGLLGLAEKEENRQQQAFFFSLMNRQLLRMDTIIRDIIDYRRIGAGEIRISRVDVGALIYDIYDQLAFLENHKRVRLRFSQESPVPFASDPYYLHVIFNNLLTNAIKYIDKQKAENHLEISLHFSEATLTVTVIDNGIGIPENLQSRIFEMFFRATIQDTGTGLGLYIAQEAVRKLNGSLHFQSEENKGSLFAVHLPNKIAEIGGESL